MHSACRARRQSDVSSCRLRRSRASAREESHRTLLAIELASAWAASAAAAYNPASWAWKRALSLAASATASSLAAMATASSQFSYSTRAGEGPLRWSESRSEHMYPRAMATA